MANEANANLSILALNYLVDPDDVIKRILTVELGILIH